MTSNSFENRRRRRCLPSLFSGVYTEFIGNKPLPKTVRERQIVFIFGPAGVGKTIVAKHLFDGCFTLYKQQQLMDAFLQKVRRRRWPSELSSADNLIIEGPCFLEQRPQILSMLQSLIRLRFKKGLRTIILDAEDLGPVREILRSIPHEDRATILLRFPEGRGRYRFLAHVCRERGIPIKHARRLMDVTPWTYSGVFNDLESLNLDFERANY